MDLVTPQTESGLWRAESETVVNSLQPFFLPTYMYGHHCSTPHSHTPADFGIGPWRAESKALVNSLQPLFSLAYMYGPRCSTPHSHTPTDFGIGPWRAESEALVNSLQPSYQLKQLRVYGDDVRVLRAHPGQWQVWGSVEVWGAAGVSLVCLRPCGLSTLSTTPGRHPSL